MSKGIRRSGILICGGSSERFGERDKILTDLAGRPLVTHVTDRIEGIVDDIVVNCHPDQREPLAQLYEETPVSLAIDDHPGEGPLEGIRRGLKIAEGEYAVVVACDMPFVDPEFAEYLFGLASEAQAAIPRQDDGWYQPLQAVYEVEPFLDAVDEAIATGVSRPIEPALGLEHVVVWNPMAVASENTFYDVNTPEDLSNAVAMLD